ncbi:MAG TPA: DUF2339 domain-containing protein, partial [Steroidobacteraceae bacterium]|nr:DUF2339 domain-containing protein [Steroidobacteraceae bacterium]
MEGLIFLAVILLLSIPVLWIIVLSRGGGDLRPRLDALEQRLAALRVTIDRLAASVPAPPAAPVPEQAAHTAAPPLIAAPPEVTASPPPHPAMPPEAVAPAPPRPSVSPPTAAVPRPPRESWEQQIMRRWAVWLGALALALGGVFLVKYSIEQGFFGPAARVVAGSLLGLALVAASEWTRRRPLPAATLGGLSPDYVPPALAAAGTVVLFASVYGGYALYDLLAPAPAFVLLAIVALGGAALSLLHGVVLAWLGLAGAYVVPLLVSAHEPSVPRLLAYVLAVSGGCLWLVRWRDWPWLGWAAVAGSGFWGVIALSLAGASNTQWIGTYLALLALLFLAVAAGEEGVHRRHAAVVWSGLAMLALLMLVLGLQAMFDATSLVFAWVLTALYAAAGVRWARFDRLPWIAALLQVLVLAFWIFEAGAGSREHLDVLVKLPPNTPLGAYLETATLVAALAGFGGFAMLGRAPRPDRWALLSATTPLAVLAAVYWRVEQFEQSLSWATAAFLLAATFLAAVEYLMPRRAKPGFTNALAYYALAVTAALALGLTLSLRLGWLSVALSLQLPAMAWLHERTGVGALRSAAVALGVIVLARLLLDPAVADYDFGARPIVNGLLYTYGIPAACFALTARRLRRSAD